MLTRKQKIRQNKAIQRANSLYYKHKRELEKSNDWTLMSDFKFVGQMILKKSYNNNLLHKEIVFTKEERIKLKKLAKKYRVDLDTEKQDEQTNP